ncbi:uncharacterized protein LOC120356824 isoform X2 [Solenopsis invicta]|uniref:uncharacterized protein LOC120356824 isoform X2 n=1 Tax=Solenopsis invicta TaxID=13686 RepID=UPI00193CCEA2|nr:uncharacterized protein LOC120356824 isoform X2 [Solenopsis invicta]
MPRSCYLCKRKTTEDEKITLHKFPKTPEIRKKWIDACGFHEKDVSKIYICSHHFDLPNNTEKRLPPGAIPTVQITVPNQSVESNASTMRSTTVNTSKSFEVNIFNADVMDCANAVHSISEALTYHSSCEENISPPRKKRMFAEPRYISEINTSNVSTPRRARRVISFIKQKDKKKSEQIKSIQDENRRLRKRIVTL